MADIDFLSSGMKSSGGKKDDKKDGEKEDLRMHVPEALPEEDDKASEPSGFIAGMKKLLHKDVEETPPGDFLHPRKPKVRVIPPKPAAPPHPMKPSAPPAPKAHPPKPPAPSPLSTKPAPPSSPKPVTPPKPPVSPPPPPKPPKPQPPQPPKPPKSQPPQPPKKEDNGATLRVSLLGAGGASSMTSLTVRARFKTFIIVVILSLAVNGIIYGGILFYKSRVFRTMQEISSGVEDLDRKISDAEKVVVPAQDFQKLADLSRRLLDRHLHWTNFLSMLEKRTLTEVQFMNMTGVETGSISTNILAKDYTTLAKQILMLESDPSVLEVALNGASAKFNGIRISLGANAAIRIQFDPNLLQTAPDAGEDTALDTTQ